MKTMKKNWSWSKKMMICKKRTRMRRNYRTRHWNCSLKKLGSKKLIPSKGKEKDHMIKSKTSLRMSWNSMMLMTNITLLTNMKNQSKRIVKIQVSREDPQKSRERTLIIEERKIRQVSYVDSILKRKISKILL